MAPVPASDGVAVVCDSTASLSAAMAGQHGVELVPLHVIVGARTYSEGVDISGREVASLLRGQEYPLSTSGPSPGQLAHFYGEVARRRGVRSLVSVHLSSRISRTVESARLAAAEVAEQIEVTVVDSRTLGLAMGYAVCAGADLATAGQPAQVVADTVAERAAACSAYFYVDTLEYLRHGGRIGKASALLGGALAIKPLLTVADGEVQPWERVRTRAKALARLRAQTVSDIGAHLAAGRPVRVGIHHLDAADRAEGFAAALQADLAADAEVPVDIVELGAVIGVHTGPGTVAVVVCPEPAPD
ncbi:MAG TPA: DegV family protein [Ornithinimicrobium sp.]|uniref:DegV family protein n=1 Tax=Ornithinimicrobium sp. TaxID=1977084 RepID=UPI002B4A98B6|nr:DegV family protein [Ornithinimicrobium sp.]HKJ12563.1 DegV family protein [Ornithinimicrobium sp.]